MTFKDFQTAAMRTDVSQSHQESVAHASLMLVSEVQEISDLFDLYPDYATVRSLILKELGDALWAVAKLAKFVSADIKFHESVSLLADTPYHINKLREYAAILAGPAQKLFQGHEYPVKYHSSLQKVVYFIQALAAGLGASTDEVTKMNIDKLVRRYPIQFSVEQSVNRIE